MLAGPHRASRQREAPECEQRDIKALLKACKDHVDKYSKAE